LTNIFPIDKVEEPQPVGIRFILRYKFKATPILDFDLRQLGSIEGDQMSL
jgi:hypothetical protein